MNKWTDLIQEFGLGEFKTSVVTLYNLYAADEGFSDQVFYEAMVKAIPMSKHEDKFFDVLIKEIVKGIQKNSTYRFLLPSRTHA